MKTMKILSSIKKNLNNALLRAAEIAYVIKYVYLCSPKTIVAEQMTL